MLSVGESLVSSNSRWQTAIITFNGVTVNYHLNGVLKVCVCGTGLDFIVGWAKPLEICVPFGLLSSLSKPKLHCLG